MTSDLGLGPRSPTLGKVCSRRGLLIWGLVGSLDSTRNWESRSAYRANKSGLSERVPGPLHFRPFIQLTCPIGARPHSHRTCKRYRSTSWVCPFLMREGNSAHRIVLKEQPWPRAFLKQSGRLRPAGLCFGLESLWARQNSNPHFTVACTKPFWRPNEAALKQRRPMLRWSEGGLNAQPNFRGSARSASNDRIFIVCFGRSFGNAGCEVRNDLNAVRASTKCSQLHFRPQAAGGFERAFLSGYFPNHGSALRWSIRT